MATKNKLLNIMIDIQEQKFSYKKFYMNIIYYTKYVNTFRRGGGLYAVSSA